MRGLDALPQDTCETVAFDSHDCLPEVVAASVAECTTWGGPPANAAMSVSGARGAGINHAATRMGGSVEPPILGLSGSGRSRRLSWSSAVYGLARSFIQTSRSSVSNQYPSPGVRLSVLAIAPQYSACDGDTW